MFTHLNYRAARPLSHPDEMPGVQHRAKRTNQRGAAKANDDPSDDRPPRPVRLTRSLAHRARNAEHEAKANASHESKYDDNEYSHARAASQNG